MISKTLSPENQLKIKCPIFGAESRISACFELRDRVWRGERVEVRQGCQCAMNAGKCPIPVLLTRMVRTNEDNYHSPEPKVRTFDFDVLDRISPVLFNDAVMKRFALSAQEEKAMLQTNDDAKAGKHKVASKPRRVERVAQMEEIAKAPPTVSDATITAAATGDLSAAINTEKAA